MFRLKKVFEQKTTQHIRVYNKYTSNLFSIFLKTICQLDNWPIKPINSNISAYEGGGTKNYTTY